MDSPAFLSYYISTTNYTNMNSNYYRAAIQHIMQTNGSVRIEPALGRPSQGSTIANDSWAQQFHCFKTPVVKLVRVCDNATRIFTLESFNQWCHSNNVLVDLRKCLVVPRGVKREKWHWNQSLKLNGKDFNVGYMYMYGLEY